MTTDAEITDTPPRPIPWRTWAGFVLGALLLYAGLYAWSEWLVYRHAEHNRFFEIHTTPPGHFDLVILGASHGMPLGYHDMNSQLEQAIGARAINLSSEGAGVLPNRLMLSYFLSRHDAKRVLYVADAFAFYDSQWNEDRLDAAMFNRAPLDFTLARILWAYPWARDVLPVYLSGFGKINNSERFEADTPEGATKFDEVYRPIAQLDRQRMRFLFPEDGGGVQFDRYLDEFERLVAAVNAAGMELVAIRPPTPPRYRDRLPDIAPFTDKMDSLAEEGRIVYRDLSETVTDEQYFYDTDHLNRDGVIRFLDEYLAPLLRAEM